MIKLIRDLLFNNESVVFGQIVVEIDACEQLLKMRAQLPLLKCLERLVKYVGLVLKVLVKQNLNLNHSIYRQVE